MSFAKGKTGDEPLKVKQLLKAADNAIKAKKDQAKAEVNLVEALGRNDLTHNETADIYQKAYQLEKSMMDALNMKAYLKEKYDTTAFFSTVLKMHSYLLACDSVEQMPDEKGVVKYRYRKQNIKNLMAKGVRNNLYVGGRYLTRKGEMASAYDYFDLYVTSAYSPLLSTVPGIQQDTVINHAVYLATLTAFSAKNYHNALKYVDYAIGTTKENRRKAVLCEYKVRCYEAINDKKAWREQLEQSVQQFPSHDYFYLHLIDAFQEGKEWDRGIALSDSLLEVVGDKAIYYLGKAQMLAGKEEFESCIDAADKAIAMNAKLANAHYYKGVAALNVAMKFSETACNDVRNPKCLEDRQQMRKLYQRALTPMETLREMEPNSPWRWAEALYRIYLHLNMGEKFAEIEKILNKA